MRTRLAIAMTATLLVAGCGAAKVAPPPTRTLIGTTFRYEKSRYKLTGEIPSDNLGKRLGLVTEDGQRFAVYTVEDHGVIPANEIAFVSVGHGRAHSDWKGVDLSTVSGTWHLGIYTVRELPLPATYFANEGQDYILGDTLLTLSTTSPYTVAHRSLDAKRSGSVTIGNCAVPPVWGHGDSLPWPEAPLVCEQEGQNSTLLLIGNGGESLTAIPLPPRPRAAAVYDVWALGYQGPDFQYVLWRVDQSESASPPLGSGMTNLQTGQDLPYPQALSSALYVSPHGALYALDGATLERWNGSGLTPLGTLPNPRVEAVDDSGAAWASVVSEGSAELVQEVPSQSAVHTWTVEGSVVGYGPGYIAWVPQASGGTSLRVMFPLEGKTLDFSGLTGVPLTLGQTNGDLLSPIVFQTASGGEVVEISTAPQ